MKTLLISALMLTPTMSWAGFFGPFLRANQPAFVSSIVVGSNTLTASTITAGGDASFAGDLSVGGDIINTEFQSLGVSTATNADGLLTVGLATASIASNKVDRAGDGMTGQLTIHGSSFTMSNGTINVVIGGTNVKAPRTPGVTISNIVSGGVAGLNIIAGTGGYTEINMGADDTGRAYTRIVANPAGDMNFVTNNATRAVILDGGNMGIGTLTPCTTCNLHVAGDVSITEDLELGGLLLQNNNGFKSVDQSTGNNTLTPDNDLYKTLMIGATDHFDFTIHIFNDDAGPDFIFQIYEPTSGLSTMTASCDYNAGNKSASYGFAFDGFGVTKQLNIAATYETVLHCHGMIEVGETGVFGLKWAQENTDAAHPVTVERMGNFKVDRWRVRP